MGREYQQKVKEITIEKHQLIHENEGLKQQLSEADQEILQLKTQVDSLGTMLEEKDSDYEAEKQKAASLSSIKDLYTVQVTEIKSLKLERDQLNQQVQDFMQQCETLNTKMQDEFSRISAERNNANQELNELFVEKSEKDIVIKTLTNENLELNSRMTALEQLLCAKED